jgi:hypothetical protein
LRITSEQTDLDNRWFQALWVLATLKPQDHLSPLRRCLKEGGINQEEFAHLAAQQRLVKEMHPGVPSVVCAVE